MAIIECGKNNMKRKRRNTIEVRSGCFIDESDFKVVDRMFKEHLKATGSNPDDDNDNDDEDDDAEENDEESDEDDNYDNNDDEDKKLEVCIRSDDDDDDEEMYTGLIFRPEVDLFSTFRVTEEDEDSGVVCLMILESVRSLPNFLLQLDALETIKIKTKRIEIPRWVGELTSLERLFIELDDGQSLPKGISHFPNLQYLEVEGKSTHHSRVLLAISQV
jgi:hypothetical protein